jgi:hypothetical protein
VLGVAFTFNQDIISRPYTAEVKIQWSCTSIPPIYLHGMNIRKSLHLRSAPILPSNKLRLLARQTQGHGEAKQRYSGEMTDFGVRMFLVKGN